MKCGNGLSVGNVGDSDGCCAQPESVEFIPRPTLATAVYVAKVNMGRRPGAVVRQSTTYDGYSAERVREPLRSKMCMVPHQRFVAALFRLLSSPPPSRLGVHSGGVMGYSQPWVLSTNRRMMRQRRVGVTVLWAFPPVPCNLLWQCVNNNVSGMGEHLCNHTLREWNPYWEVDLGSVNIISEVKVWNREDSPEDTAYPADYFTGRLFPCWIFLSQVPFPTTSGKAGYAMRVCGLVRGCGAN